MVSLDDLLSLFEQALAIGRRQEAMRIRKQILEVFG